MFETEEEMERFSTQLILFSSRSAEAAAAADADAAAADAADAADSRSSPKLLLSTLFKVAKGTLIFSYCLKSKIFEEDLTFVCGHGPKTKELLEFLFYLFLFTLWFISSFD